MPNVNLFIIMGKLCAFSIIKNMQNRNYNSI